MQITGRTRVFFVLGDPVAQVQAPTLFNTLFDRHGVDAVLVPVQVAPAELPRFAGAALAAGNVGGLWLTIPHKTAMAERLDRCDAAGLVAGSVNAVRRDADGALAGGLFDGSGFVKAMRFHGFEPRGARVLLVGAGGAGIAIAAALAAVPVGTLALFDAAPGRAAEAAARLEGGAAALALPPEPDPRGFDLVINATPLGLKAGDPLPFDVAGVDAGALVLDILMTPEPTPLLRGCAARGLAAHAGFEMLVQQVPDYLDFFGLHTMARAVQADLGPARALISPR